MYQQTNKRFIWCCFMSAVYLCIPADFFHVFVCRFKFRLFLSENCLCVLVALFLFVCMCICAYMCVCMCVQLMYANCCHFILFHLLIVHLLSVYGGSLALFSKRTQSRFTIIGRLVFQHGSGVNVCVRFYCPQYTQTFIILKSATSVFRHRYTPILFDALQRENTVQLPLAIHIFPLRSLRMLEFSEKQVLCIASLRLCLYYFRCSANTPIHSQPNMRVTILYSHT